MGEHSVDYVVAKYILDCLSSEFLFRPEPEHELKQRPPQRPFLIQHIMQFYWTITRFAGLEFLHNPKAEDASEDPINLYTYLHADGERRVRDFVPWALDDAKKIGSSRLLLDVTSTFLIGSWTGIQRVTREVTKFAVKRGLGIPVVLHEGGVMSADIYRGTLRPFELRAGDNLFLLDSTWMGDMKPVRSAMHSIKAQGGSIVACVHDILPLQYPLLFPQGHAIAFQESVRELMYIVDGYVTVSETVARTLRSYIENSPRTADLLQPIRWAHNGSDLPSIDTGKRAIDPTLSSLRERPFFICVGTVEPRKGHIVALEAFERLWSSDFDLVLAIIGKPGWMMQAFEDRLVRHPEWNKRLFRFSNIDDYDLSFAYKNAQALIMPAVAEGFGLPTIEAARLGLPVIASDIPIMREVGKESFYYFDLLDAKALATAVAALLSVERSQRAVLKEILTWEEASANFLSNALDILSSDRRSA